MEESFKIQALKGNLNPLSGIFSYYPQGMIYDDDFVPFKSYVLLKNEFEQLDIPICPHGNFYVKFTPLNPYDDQETLERT